MGRGGGGDLGRDAYREQGHGIATFDNSFLTLLYSPWFVPPSVPVFLPRAGQGGCITAKHRGESGAEANGSCILNRWHFDCPP